MADLLDDFDTFLVAQGVILTGTLFKDTMDDNPDTAVAVYEYEGTSGLPQIAGTSRSIQFVTRDMSALAAKQLAVSLHNALVTEDGIINLTTSRWGLLILRQTPFKLKVDDRKRIYYCFNVGITTFADT